MLHIFVEMILYIQLTEMQIVLYKKKISKDFIDHSLDIVKKFVYTIYQIAIEKDINLTR